MRLGETHLAWDSPGAHVAWGSLMWPGVASKSIIAMWTYNDTNVSWSLEYRHKLLAVSCISVITAKCSIAVKSLGLGSLALGSQSSRPWIQSVFIVSQVHV